MLFRGMLDTEYLKLKIRQLNLPDTAEPFYPIRRAKKDRKKDNDITKNERRSGCQVLSFASALCCTNEMASVLTFQHFLQISLMLAHCTTYGHVDELLVVRQAHHERLYEQY